ncbi:hypothetical protein KVT40_004197 [Elsinoe batatas]|uniref:Cytochrome P450 n=1 Tax=Elsinoe batatas TaxID=2601811 RepID=A0A8K0L279_9PEZI|nr:hypothetical protein KVT40_004197 [Elsinoe batatas]
MLDIFGTKLYISKTYRLTSAVQRSSKTLSFKPFQKITAQKMGGGSAAVVDKFTDHVIDDFSHAQRASFTPGPELDAQTVRLGERALVDIESLIIDDKPTSLMLLKWSRHAVVQATCCGVFGIAHPFLDPKVEDAYWTWQAWLVHSMAGVDITGRGNRSRAIVFDAMQRYCAQTPTDIAPVVTERSRVMREAGLSEKEIADQQGSFCIAAFANTVPTLFWTIYELFSRPTLLAAVRDEITSTAISGSSEKAFTLDVTILKTKCPLILSVMQETQRMRHVHAYIRKVTEDTLLDGKWLLKKGHFLQMPCEPIHREKTVWGEAADNFDPYRFMPSKGHKSVPPSSFAAWGAPPHLCPARRFATTEILIVLALLAVRTDIEPEGGRWEENPAVDLADIVTLHNPKRDIKVKVQRRKEWLGEWRLDMGESKTRGPLASG